MHRESNFFTTLRILHLSLLVGPVLFGIASVFIVQNGLMQAAEESLSRILQVIAILFSVALMVIGFNLFKRKIMEVRNSTGEAKTRLEQYRAACILWWAMNEAPALFSITCYLLTGNFSFLALAGFHILILLVFMPRKENIAVLLNVDPHEID